LKGKKWILTHEKIIKVLGAMLSLEFHKSFQILIHPNISENLLAILIAVWDPRFICSPY
jgi:hypothetical protein